MMLKEIIEKCGMLSVCEQRCITDEYTELVFFNKELDKWNKIFVDIFGQAIKPTGVKPTEDNLRLTKDYGGIHDNQILFEKKFDDVTVIAMFWPWQDNIHTTLKMALLRKEI